MVWIEIDNPNTKLLQDTDGTLGTDVEFTDNQTANVSESVAEAMVEFYDDVHYKNQ